MQQMFKINQQGFNLNLGFKVEFQGLILNRFGASIVGALIFILNKRFRNNNNRTQRR